MKKWMSALLAAAMMVSMCGCGGSTEAASSVAAAPEEKSEVVSIPEAVETAASEAEAETETENVPAQVWETIQTTDEFGDVTEDSFTALQTSIDGEFSNTATAGSEVTGDVRFARKPNSEHYLMQIALLEYGKSPITYYSSDSLTLKVKIGDTIYEYTLTGESPNGSLFLSNSEYDYSADTLFNVLYAGEDLRCILYIGSSQYNFVIESGNFAQICDANDFPAASASASAMEVVRATINDVSEVNKTAFFTEHREELELLDDAKLNTLLDGTNFLQIDLKRQSWYYFRYHDNVRTQYARYADVVVDHKSIGRTYEETEEYNMDISVEDSVYSEYNYVGLDGSYQIRYIADGFYISYAQDDNGEYTVPDELWIQLDESGNQMYPAE